MHSHVMTQRVDGTRLVMLVKVQSFYDDVNPSICFSVKATKVKWEKTKDHQSNKQFEIFHGGPQ